MATTEDHRFEFCTNHSLWGNSYTCKQCGNRDQIDPDHDSFVLPSGAVNCKNFDGRTEGRDGEGTAMGRTVL
jgi:hypothetical protein